jgi:hypothetical protein
MEMSADTLRATVDKSTDLPTPDPEKPNRALRETNASTSAINRPLGLPAELLL